VTGSCEYYDELSVSVNDEEFLDHLNDYQILRRSLPHEVSY
jgi:hypothetical protein